ncbi:MAG: tetratricopeptide repeat protein [Acidobacteriota bacterium]|nr:tetratricopeptide repeat protein [Acidobacteriota bacterium]
MKLDAFPSPRRFSARGLAYRFAGFLALALFLASVLALPCKAQSASDVSIDSNEQIFDVMAALNAGGYDTGLYSATGGNTRQEVRDYLAKENLPVVAQIAHFYAAHRIAGDPGADLGQYISLALLLGPPPDFAFTIAKEDLPPDASDVRDLVPLLRSFYKEANLEELYARLRPRYMDFIQAYSPSVRRDIALSDAYLRFASGSYLGRQYRIYVCLLGAPEQAQARIYGENYYLVITPSVSPRFKAIRHQYLHFLLDPLAMKYAGEIHQKAALQAIARKAPALDDYDKNDFTMLVTECLIHAVELRMDKPPDALKRANADMASGLILTPYFYNALIAYEKGPSSLSLDYPSMIQGIDVRKMADTLADVKFTQPPPSRIVKTARAGTTEGGLLDQGDNLIAAAQYDTAASVFQKVLKEYDPQSPRALYGLAVAASNTGEPDVAEKYFKRTLASAHDLRIVTWSHIYLGRIYDVEGRRADALKQYRAASVTAGTFPDALLAVRQGMLHPFAEAQ